MRVDERFIIKFPPVDTLSTSAVALRHVAALDHKILDDAVERAPLVVQTFVAVTYRQEIIYRFWYCIII